MNTITLPMSEKEWESIHSKMDGASIMTPLSVTEGDVLDHLETSGPEMLMTLIEKLGWPAPVLLMAVGALVKEGLVRIVRMGSEILLEAIPT